MFRFQIFSEIRPVSSLFFVFFEHCANLIKLFLILLYKISQKAQDTLNCALLKILLDKRNTRRYNKRNETAMTSVIQFTCLPFLYFCKYGIKRRQRRRKRDIIYLVPFYTRRCRLLLSQILKGTIGYEFNQRNFCKQRI